MTGLKKDFYKTKVLDSYPIFRMGLKQILVQMKLQLKGEINIFEAENVRTAMKIIKKEHIDLVISDVDLYGKSGFDLLIMMSEMDKLKFKIIFMAADGRQSAVFRAKELKAHGFIMKNAFAEDIDYAIKVVRRGDKYYSPKCLSEISHNIELTRREKDVFTLLRLGKTNQEIGKELFISEATTKKHVSNILGKLGLKNRVEAAVLYNK